VKLEDIIIKRVSHAKFNEKEVDVDFLIQLLESAVYTPNHKMREPWRFIILDSLGKKQFLKDYLTHIPKEDTEATQTLLNKLFIAPIILVMVMKKEPNIRDEKEDLLAMGALTQNFLLLLTSYGISSFWKTPNYIDHDVFKTMLGLTTDEIVTGMIMIGYPLNTLAPKTRKLARSKTIIYRSDDF
jgi:nitroreductase